MWATALCYPPVALPEWWRHHGSMDPQWVETIIVGWIAIVYRIMEYNREGGLIFVTDGLD